MSRRCRRAAVVATSALLVAAAVVTLRTVRVGEATASRRLLTALGVPARQIGATVVVDSPRGGAGFTVAAGCSSVLLLLPFAVLALAMVGSGRVRARTAALALAAPVMLLPVVNQIRFALIGASIDRWGFHRGYGPAHLIAGTVVSTVGLVAALAAFVRWGVRSAQAEPS